MICTGAFALHLGIPNPGAVIALVEIYPIGGIAFVFEGFLKALQQFLATILLPRWCRVDIASPMASNAILNRSNEATKGSRGTIFQPARCFMVRVFCESKSDQCNKHSNEQVAAHGLS
ncbi:hypothetical protein Ae201684P_021260 [Aphanomyces euteiches]|nr:hypothetical protein Ae201684P_021260 [Aphanomyces euteiches]